jgi:DNA-binding LacI/PurR family transcriptional regulator
MTDVAELAGVSVMTVSRVLNDHPNVSARMRDRVKTAIAELDYRRNSAARALATSYSRTVGVVSFGASQVGQYETIRAVQESAQDADYFVSLANVRNLRAASITRAIDSLLSAGVDGIIVIAPHYEALTIIDDLPAKVPTLVVGPRGRFEFSSVSVDQSKGAEIAAHHLLDLGHRRLAHIAGPLDWLDAKLRLESWHRTLQREGVEDLPAVIGDWEPQSGFDAMVRLLADEDITGVFVSSDHMALGALHALHQLKRRVPEDVSVIGFGNTAGSAFFEPALTTISVDYDAIGRECLVAMSDLVTGVPSAQAVIEPKLIVRESTAPVA